MTISSRHTHTRRAGRLTTVIALGWIIVSALIRLSRRAAVRREDSPLAAKPPAPPPRTEPAALPREPGRGRLERAAVWTQVIALPIAAGGLIYAGLAYASQAADAQQVLNSIRVQQQLLKTQEASIEGQVAQLQTATLSTEEQQQLVAAIRQLTTVEKQLAALDGGNKP